MALLDGIQDPTLRKLVDSLKDSTLLPDDSVPAGFLDGGSRLTTISADEVEIRIHVLPGGVAARISIEPRGSTKGVKGIQGLINLSVLATKLV